MSEHLSDDPNTNITTGSDTEPGRVVVVGPDQLQIDGLESPDPVVETDNGPSVVERGANHAGLAINGLRQGVARVRVGRAQASAAEAETTGEVHREAVDTFMAPTYRGRVVPSRVTGAAVIQNEKKTSDSTLPAGASVQASGRYRPVDPDLRPHTLAERRRAKRAADDLSEASLIRTTREHELQQIWGLDIGSPQFEARIQASRMPNKIKRAALKAQKEFVAIEAKAVKLRKEGLEATLGEDKFGKKMTKRSSRKKEKASRLSGHLSGLEASAQQRRNALEGVVEIDEVEPEASDSEQLLLFSEPGAKTAAVEREIHDDAAMWNGIRDFLAGKSDRQPSTETSTGLTSVEERYLTKLLYREPFVDPSAPDRITKYSGRGRDKKINIFDPGKLRRKEVTGERDFNEALERLATLFIPNSVRMRLPEPKQTGEASVEKRRQNMEKLAEAKQLILEPVYATAAQRLRDFMGIEVIPPVPVIPVAPRSPDWRPVVDTPRRGRNGRDKPTGNGDDEQTTQKAPRLSFVENNSPDEENESAASVEDIDVTSAERSLKLLIEDYENILSQHSIESRVYKESLVALNNFKAELADIKSVGPEFRQLLDVEAVTGLDQKISDVLTDEAHAEKDFRSKKRQDLLDAKGYLTEEEEKEVELEPNGDLTDEVWRPLRNRTINRLTNAYIARNYSGDRLPPEIYVKLRQKRDEAHARRRGFVEQDRKAS